MRVFNEESIFISLEKCSCTVFLLICRGYFDCTCALAQSISIRRDRIRVVLSLPRLALRAEKFQESSLCIHYVL
jgi:predicted nucleic acid-binding Zn finger protein